MGNPETTDVKPEAIEELSEIKVGAKTVTLTLKQLWIVGTIAFGLFGTVFGVGTKVGGETMKAVLQDDFNKKMEIQVSLLLESKREAKEYKEDMLYYKGRYEVTLERFKKCNEDGSGFLK